MKHRCPCCGSELQCPGLLWLPLAGVLLRASDELAAVFTRSEAAILDVLWQPYVAGSNQATRFPLLTEAVYKDDPRGGPDGATLCVYQFIHKIKQKLKPFGLKLYVRDHTVMLCQVEITQQPRLSVCR